MTGQNNGHARVSHFVPRLSKSATIYRCPSSLQSTSTSRTQDEFEDSFLLTEQATKPRGSLVKDASPHRWWCVSGDA